MSRRPELLRDPAHEVALAVLCSIASAWLVWDAYEARGRKRPFVTRVLPVL